jgi:type 1 fimbria pilin
MKFTTTLLALAIASSAALAPTASAQSADVSIGGRIYPGACTLSLGSDGIADLGDIRAETLNQDAETRLATASLPFDVTCQSNVRFALEGTDNTGSSDNPTLYGLGMTPADERIGRMSIHLANYTTSTQFAYYTYSTDNGMTWSNSLPNAAAIRPDRMAGFTGTTNSSAGPAAIRFVRGNLELQPTIRPASGLTFTEDVQINGNVTLSLTYL